MPNEPLQTPFISIDEAHCIQCGQCIADCPVRIISMPEGGYPSLIEGRENNCLRCQHCLAVCPVGALSFMNHHPQDSTPLKKNLPAPHQLKTLMAGRRSVRSFKQESISAAALDELLEATAHAPTGKNNEQVLLTVVDNAETMQNIRCTVMSTIETMVAENTLPEEYTYFKSLLRPWKKGQDLIFRNAPHMLIASSPNDGPSPQEDPIIAMTHFDLMAQNMGVGTLWCGFALWSLMNICPDIGKQLGIPVDHNIGYVMLFGHPAIRYHRTVQRKANHINRVTFPAR